MEAAGVRAFGRARSSRRPTSSPGRSTRPRSDGDLWLELEEIWAWLGRASREEAAWERALDLLPAPRAAAPGAAAAASFATVICHPGRRWAAYREAERALAADPATPGRADVLIGLAWGEAVAGDPGTECEALLAAAEALAARRRRPRGPLADIAEIRMQGLIRQGRFADAVEIARTAGRRAPSATGWRTGRTRSRSTPPAR